MFDLFDDAALRVRAQLAADSHIAGLRQLTRKPRRSIAVAYPRLAGALDMLGFMTGVRPFDPRYFAILALLVTGIVGLSTPLAGAAMSCRSEDSAVAEIGTDRFGCVWWGGVQGNSTGRTVWNRPTR